MEKLTKGIQAPVFNGFDQDGKEIKLSDLKGKKIILYFYPKDFTSGCTAEAENLRDNFDFWEKSGYTIIGVSPDSVDSHCKFKDKHNLPFTLISDEDLKIANLYHVYGPKKMYGREYMGIYRTTFVIDGNGTIVDIIEKVKTKDHSAQLVKLLEL
ncbi:MAG: thioredoxin-dependent thiol peroxidase [Saprospiraceae bacterium]